MISCSLSASFPFSSPSAEADGNYIAAEADGNYIAAEADGNYITAEADSKYITAEADGKYIADIAMKRNTFMILKYPI